MKPKADQWMTVTAIHEGIRPFGNKAARSEALFRQLPTKNLVSLKKASTIKQSQNYTA